MAVAAAAGQLTMLRCFPLSSSFSSSSSSTSGANTAYCVLMVLLLHKIPPTAGLCFAQTHRLPPRTQLTIGAARIKAGAASSEKARGERKQRLTGQPWRLGQMPGGDQGGFGPLCWPAVTPSVGCPLGKPVPTKMDKFLVMLRIAPQRFS